MRNPDLFISDIKNNSDLLSNQNEEGLLIFIILETITNLNLLMIKYILIFVGCTVLASCNPRSLEKKSYIIEGPTIITEHAIVVSDHPQGSRIGIEILKKGGNAVDGAVATGFALAVCYPEAGNIGGGGFMLIRTPDGKVDVLDYREKAPLNSSRDMYLDKKGNVIEGLSTNTHLACGVPGSVNGLLTAHEKYGKLALREIIQPAIDLASNGFPVSARQAASFNNNRKIFIERNTGKIAFIKDSLWKEGDILKQPELAETLIRIRDFGKDGFYSGQTAELLIGEMKRGNGAITAKDLLEYRSVWREPLTGNYRGYKIITVGPPSGGGVILLQLLKMTESHNLKEMGFHTAQSIHFITEVERRAFADRAEFLGDPDFAKIPVRKLTNAKYLADRMKSFNPDQASLSTEIGHGLPEPYESEQTTHYSVVDSMGNAVSVTTTLNNTFGNSILVEGAGFLLNNEMDDFSSKPGFPNMFGLVGGEANSIHPGKRMLSSMTPTILEKNGKLFLVAGSPGGSTIPTTVFQVIVNVLDFGMSVQNAVNGGRFHHQWLPDYISYETKSIDSLTVKKLESLGHKLKVRDSIGLVNAIQILPDGKRAGGADPRGYNTASGY
jgi:gamma-glutamyltranspeptidase / glutathione hydrolase